MDIREKDDVMMMIMMTTTSMQLIFTYMLLVINETRYDIFYVFVNIG